MIKQSVPFLACLALLAGCVNFQYVGETESPSGNEVSVYTDATRIGRSYRVLGRRPPRATTATSAATGCSPNSKARRKAKEPTPF